jgi:hypothetical protein
MNPKSEDLYSKLLNSSLAEMNAMNQRLADGYGLGSHDRWDVDQTTGVLAFSNGGATEVICDVEILGTYSSITSTWLWGWANESVLKVLTENVLRVKEYGEREGLNDLRERKVECSEAEAWAFAALASKVLGGLGVYRGPTGRGYVMMMIKTIRKADGEQCNRP